MLKLIRGSAKAPQRTTPKTFRSHRPLRTGDVVSDWVLGQFATEGALGGEEWGPNSPATLSLRVQLGRGRGGK